MSRIANSLLSRCWPARLATILVVLISAFGSAAADPAVSGINGKLSAFGGAHGNGFDDDRLGGLSGSFTIPLGVQFGAQFDAAWARTGGEDAANTGVHVFWRDPAKGLIGLYGGFAHLTDEGGFDLGRVGLEAQYFAGKTTFDLATGYRFGDIDEDGYVRAKLDYYVLDDLKVSGGFVYEDDSFALTAAEYQFASTADAGASLFAEGRVHDEDRYTVMAGVKVYFGEQMSLISRHRRQDPDGYLDLDLIALKAAAAARARNNQSAGGSGGTSGGAAACPFTPSPDCTIRLNQCDTAAPALTAAQSLACNCPSGC